MYKYSLVAGIFVTNSQSYQLNEPKVTGERLDGEYILLHFETGCYFSVVGTAADVCQLLFSGTATSEILESLASHYELDREVMQQSIDAFVAQLVDEDLIVVAESTIVVAESTTNPIPTAPPFSGKFTELAIEKFDDMSEQLLLDPIHEIDERGWPQSKPS